MKAKRKPKRNDYAVGYCKPPPEHQFKKGQSGNPGGHKKATSTFSEAIEARFDEVVRISGDRGVVAVTKRELALRNLVRRGLLHRNKRALLTYIRLMRQIEPWAQKKRRFAIKILKDE